MPPLGVLLEPEAFVVLPAALLPVWFVAPIAGATMLVIAGHLIALRSAELPEPRRRIRQANGAVMLVAVPMLGFGVGYADPDDPGVFVYIWLSAMGLIWLVMMMAMADMAWTWRQSFRERRALRGQLAELRREAARLTRARRDAEQADTEPGDPGGDRPVG